MEKRSYSIKSDPRLTAYLPGTYTICCLQCDFGAVRTEANNLGDAIDKGLKPHDEYHSRGLAMCGGDHLKIFCPDGTMTET